MSDLTLREPMLPEPSRGDLWIIWTGFVSLLLHAGLLAFLLWQPLPASLEAEQPPAIDVELVPPPDEAASEPPAGEEAAKDEPAAPRAGEAAESEAAPEAAEEATQAESSPAEQPQAPVSSPAEATQPAEAEAAAEEPPPAAEPAETASAQPEAAGPPAAETTATETPEPQQAPQATAKVAPIPLARPKVRALEAPADASEAAVAEPTPEASEAVAGAVVAATPEEPDVTTLQLGDPRDAERFYLEAMLSTPRLAPAREMLKTLPAEKRLAQTCNIEALAQIGYSGEGFAPDVVMAEAYALQEIIGTRLVANGAIFRSGEKWYGLAFDCTLSDDLSTVTAFTYRLGADVTEAVLKRLEKN